eukprot:TRINITY_DN1099_c0_g1_i1.p1 TRINITY_DN1099_c0_g1~~TRINITY_DN1099_c0_g1_i1.p1  ORF type:complete len:119 (-),score=21.81 TRINITY_DN1099_c0_g1_i1:189-545(-)
MARSRSNILAVAAMAVVAYMGLATTFVSPPARGSAPEVEVDGRVLAATFAGLTPLSVMQPAGAYDSVVAMLQSWLVGGTVLLAIYGAAFVAAVANPLTRRRNEVAAQVKLEQSQERSV